MEGKAGTNTRGVRELGEVLTMGQEEAGWRSRWSPVAQSLEAWVWSSGFILQEAVLLKGSRRETIMCDFQKEHQKGLHHILHSKEIMDQMLFPFHKWRG